MPGRRTVLLIIAATLALGTSSRAANVTGQVIRVAKDNIVASFDVPIERNSMMVVKTGGGEAVAGMAISESCEGAGPYMVKGRVDMVFDAAALVPGKPVEVNALNVNGAPTPPVDQTNPAPATASGYQDLKFYYYAADQTVGYGLFGFGYERTLRVMPGIGLELDAAMAGVGAVSSSDGETVDTEQLIKTMNGKLRIDFGTAMGAYAGYRWNVSQGSPDRWKQTAEELEIELAPDYAPPEGPSVVARGIEYGLTWRPAKKFAISAGFIPRFAVNYGDLGLHSKPGYTGELRVGGGRGAIRLRGLQTEDFWSVDLGVTIK